MELFIDNKEMDVYEKSINNTFQNNDLGEVKDRQSNFTNRFKLPKTPNNIKVLDLLSIAGNKSRKQYQNLPARLIDNGVEIVSDGYCYVKASTLADYEIVIYSGITSLFESIKGKSIRDLDFSNLNHPINFTNIADSFDNTEGYIYPIFASEKSNNDQLYAFRVNTMLPFVFEKTLFEKIINEAGFSFSGLESVDINDNVVAPIKGITQKFRGEESNNQILLNQYYTLDNTRRFILTTAGSQTREHALTFHSFIVTETGYYKFKANGNPNCEARHIISGTNYNQSKQVYPQDIIVTVGSESHSLKSYGTLNNPFDEEEIIFLNTGDSVVVSYYMKSTTGVTSIGLNNGTNYFDLELKANFSFEIELVVNELFADFSVLLPNISQVNFIKEVMWRYGFSLKKEKNSNNYIFKRIEDIFKERDRAIDWSDKYNGGLSEHYKIGSYAKKNNFKYSGEEGYTGFADGQMIIDNETLSDDKTLITSVYSPQLPSTKFRTNGSDDLPLEYIAYYELETDNQGIAAFNSTEEIQAKVFKIWRTTVDWQYAIINLAGQWESINGQIPLLSFDLYWQDVVNENYNALNKVLNDALLLKASIYLNTIDIYYLDFFRLIYLKQYGSYFYLNKVQNHKRYQPTKCELIRIPSDVFSYSYGGYGYGYGYGGYYGSSIEPMGQEVIGTI